MPYTLGEKSDDIARTFLDTGTFGFIPGLPTAYTQPLYSFFLIPIYALFERSWIVVGSAQILVAIGVARDRVRDRSQVAVAREWGFSAPY